MDWVWSLFRFIFGPPGGGNGSGRPSGSLHHSLPLHLVAYCFPPLTSRTQKRREVQHEIVNAFGKPTIHAFTSETGVSAIELPSAAQDDVFERSLEPLDAFNLLPRFDQDILGHPQAAQTAVRAL